MLLGSNIFPSEPWLGGRRVQLGDIVRRAYQDSRLTAEAWNSLAEREREHLLVDAYYAMRAEVK
jgi:hypothetical protein